MLTPVHKHVTCNRNLAMYTWRYVSTWHTQLIPCLNHRGMNPAQHRDVLMYVLFTMKRFIIYMMLHNVCKTCNTKCYVNNLQPILCKVLLALLFKCINLCLLKLSFIRDHRKTVTLTSNGCLHKQLDDGFNKEIFCDNFWPEDGPLRATTEQHATR